MKKLLLGFLAIVMLWGVNVSASEEEGIIDLEVKDKSLSEVVSIVSDINVKENVQSVRYEITNDKAILYVALEDATRYDETKDDVFEIDGVETLDETLNETPTEQTNETQTNTSCKCDSISEKDINSIVTANYILYATEVILLVLIVIIVVLITKKDKKKK